MYQGPECVDGIRLRLRTRTQVRMRRRNGYGKQIGFWCVNMTGTEIFWNLVRVRVRVRMSFRIFGAGTERIRIVFEKSGTGTECPTEYVRVFVFSPG